MNKNLQTTISFRFRFCFLIVLLLHVCLYSSNIKPINDQIEANRKQMCRLVKENKLDSIANFYANEAHVDGSDANLDGISSIKAYWSKINGRGVDWTWEVFSSKGSDSIVLQTGISHLTLAYGKKNVTYSSLFSVVWKKEGNGEFRIVLDFYRMLNTINTSCFEVQKDSVWVNTGNDSIFVVLFKPKQQNKSKIPAVYCLQGGGNAGISNYFYEAELFASLGMVAIVCDKAGTGKSVGKSSWVTQTFRQKVKEYSLILDWLVKQPFVDSANVGLHGPSEGGRLALSLAIVNPARVKFVNAVSAPLETFRQNQLYAIEKLLISQGYNYSIIAQTLNLFNDYFNAISKKKIPKDLIERINVLRKEYPKLYLPPNSTDLPRMPQSDDIDYGFGTDLKKIQCPVFFQYGEKDNVVNVNNSLNLIPISENTLIKVYDNVDHSINYQNGDINGSYHIDKIKWILSIVKSHK